MAKKKKIREDFDKIFAAGDEKAIKKMLDKFPWLLSEVSIEMDEVMEEQEQVLAALGVMEDELGAAVPLEEIIFSLRVDFNTRKLDGEVMEILNKTESLGLTKKDPNGWTLTNEGGRACDDFLNKTLGKIEF
jgi:hypothetical protein